MQNVQQATTDSKIRAGPAVVDSHVPASSPAHQSGQGAPAARKSPPSYASLLCSRQEPQAMKEPGMRNQPPLITT
jgi:hypothetical protein